MSDSYTNLLYHIIFSTKDRRPLITCEYEARLYDYIGGTVRGVGGISLELNGTTDHVHVLAKLRLIVLCRMYCEISKLLRLDGCMISFQNSKTSHGNEDMEHSRLANQTSKRYGAILCARRSTTRRFHFGMSSSSS